MVRQLRIPFVSRTSQNGNLETVADVEASRAALDAGVFGLRESVAADP